SQAGEDRDHVGRHGGIEKIRDGDDDRVESATQYDIPATGRQRSTRRFAMAWGNLVIADVGYGHVKRDGQKSKACVGEQRAAPAECVRKSLTQWPEHCR